MEFLYIFLNCKSITLLRSKMWILLNESAQNVIESCYLHLYDFQIFLILRPFLRFQVTFKAPKTNPISQFIECELFPLNGVEL